MRSVWWSLWAFLALTIAGDAVKNVMLYRFGQTPFPSLADALYLAAYIPAFIALGLMIRHLHPGRDREAWIDASIMTIAVGSIVGVFIVAPTLDGARSTDISTFVALAYPLLDLIILSVLILVLVSSSHLNPSVTLLTFSASLFLVVALIDEFRIVNRVLDETSAGLAALHLIAIIAMVAAAGAPGARSLGSRPPARRPARHPHRWWAWAWASSPRPPSSRWPQSRAAARWHACSRSPRSW